MIRFTFFLTVFLYSLGGFSSSNFNYIFDSVPKTPARIDVDASIFLGDLTHPVKIGDSALFGEIDSEALRLSEENVVWVKVALFNPTNNFLIGYLSACNFADSVQAFYLHNDTIRSLSITGALVPPKQKNILSTGNYLPVYIEGNEAKTIFIRYTFSKSYNKNRARFLYYIPNSYFFNSNIMGYSGQFFYLGCMLFICLIGIFMYLLFRDKIFLQFSSFMFFLGLYFPKFSGRLDSFLLYFLKNDYVGISEIIIAGIIVSAFLFFSNFTNLKRVHPWLYWMALIATILIALPLLVAQLFVFKILILSYTNIALLVWAIMVFSAIVLYARSGEEYSKSLLISVLILFSGAMVHILSLIGVFPNSSLFSHSFQVGSLVFSSVLFYILFNKVKSLKEEQKQSEKINAIKSNFFTNISHELRTPLTLMLGPIQQLYEKSTNEDDKKLLKLAAKNANRQLELVNQLLDLSKLESGKLELQIQKNDIVAFSKSLLFSYESLARKRGISLNFSSKDTAIDLYFDFDKMEKILTNLITNAVNFSADGGRIDLTIYSDINFVTLTIKDNGRGISHDNLPKVFDRFYSASNNEGITPGTGVGLSLVKELVSMHGGKVKVESTLGKGAEFNISFKLGKNHFPEHLVSETIAANFSKNSTLLEDFEAAVEEEKLEETNRNKRPLILLIEDNEDVREFIIQRIDTDYQIIEAVNGEEGINLALEHQPDLIISDVMMPIKDGFEVCKTLKTNIQTSHIPIILLTAKADQEEIIEGYEQGADAYILKPFNAQEILIRIKNLVESRLELKKRFSNSIFLKPEEVTSNSIDTAFIKNATAIIEKNLTNDILNVDFMAAALGMSKANLNRKFRVLVNLSTNQFIQSVKLKKSAELLNGKEFTVAEVAFQTGFSSPAYFIKCFKTQFGKTPKEYTE